MHSLIILIDFIIGEYLHDECDMHQAEKLLWKDATSAKQQIKAMNESVNKRSEAKKGTSGTIKKCKKCR